MEVNNNLGKLKLLLQYVIEEKIVINENYIDKLISFLEDSDANSLGKLILDTPRFSDFVYNALANVNSVSKVNTTAKVFLVRLITILFKNELQFNKMHTQGFKETFSKFCILHNLFNTQSHDLLMACIELGTAQINHLSGFNTVWEHNIWKFVLQPNIHLKPKRISNAAYNFMAKFVSTLNEYNLEDELIEVLRYVLEPIFSSEYVILQEINLESDELVCEKILSHIHALLAIVTESNGMAPNNRVVKLLREYFHIGAKLIKIFVGTKNKRLLNLLSAIYFRLCFGKLRPLLVNKKTEEFCMKMTISHRNHLVNNIMNKRDPHTVVNSIIQTNLIWSSIEKSHAAELNLPLTFEQNGQTIEFSLQIIIHLIVPVIKYVAIYRISQNLNVTELIEKFAMKMEKSITDYIYSCCYRFATLLENCSVTVRREVTIHTLKELLRLKGHLNEYQAGIIFQSLYYLLDIFILDDGTGGLVVNENPMDQDDLRLLTHLLDALKMFIKTYTISWYENVEIVTVQANLLNLLKQNFLMSKQVVKVLDLINICVKKFLSPNMSLLVDNNCKQSSTLNEIGEVIKLYTQHDEWEVRDSAFNLLNSCTEISFIKYMPLQKVIKENNLMIIASKAALTDSDFYSQCSALKCLAAATKIDSIWQEVLANNVYLYWQLVNILRNHTEGMVRKEAANVLTEVYVSQKVESTFQNSFYGVMMMAALDDLHWEVQLAALDFWKKVIHNHLTYRGMLDGKFPSVTFSKQKRKIIVLNQEEITRQLTGAMNDLSAVGCLTVLVECMKEIDSIEVMKLAYFIARELIGILDMYKCEKVNHSNVEDLVHNFNVNKNIDQPTIDLSHKPSEEERDKVIDSILSLDQAELLIRLHDNLLQDENYEMEINHICYTSRELVQPKQFLDTFRNIDYSLMIENKKKIHADNLCTLGSLLDEILNLEVISQ